MRKKMLALATAVTLAASGVASGVALGAIDDGPGNGNPATTSGSGKCPAGQNKDTSPGGLKKCP